MDRSATPHRIYVDHNATTAVHPDVLAAMLPYFCETFGNPSSIHWHGQEARRAVDCAHQQVADLLGAIPGEIVVTSGGTEANHLALHGIMASLREGHLITSAIEHPSVLATCKTLEAHGCSVTYLPVDRNGLVDLDELMRAITPKTALISIMLANNDVGTLQPINEIVACARKRNILVHTDAVQAVGKIPVNVRELDVDLLSLSAHKFGGPKGVGALFLRRGISLTPQLVGGEQELRRRAGTEDVPGIVGFGKACVLAKSRVFDGTSTRILELRHRLESLITTRISAVTINGHPTERLPNTINCTFAGIDGTSLLMNLDLHRISASVGSACASGKIEPSHVLTAMGRTWTEAQSALRISLGPENTEAEIEQIAECLADVVPRLRTIVGKPSFIPE